MRAAFGNRCGSRGVALTEANECLAQQSAEAVDLRLLCEELKSEAAASARTEASSAREQVASQAEEMQQRQLELGQVIRERDQSRGQATEASARAGTLAEGMAVAVWSAQAMASQQRARAEGMFCLLCDFVFVFILLLVSEEYCPVVFRVLEGS